MCGDSICLNIMKVVIIGSGPSVLQKKCGDFIDACDIVIRMNHFQIDGYEKHVGTKFDIYSTRWRKLLKNKHRIKNVNEIWVLWPEILNELPVWDKMRKEALVDIDIPVRYLHKSICDTYSKHFKPLTDVQGSKESNMIGYNIPDTGISTIDTALLVYPNATIYIHGIDGHSTIDGAGYYFDKPKGHNNSPVLQQWTYLSRLITSNKINII